MRCTVVMLLKKGFHMWEYIFALLLFLSKYFWHVIPSIFRDLVQDCSISIANALELQSRPTIPHFSDNTPYCTVAQYQNCLKNLKSNCDCGTPCKNTMYLPSLSFASTTTDDSSINRQDQAIENMQDRMRNAREVTYRVRSAQYR